MGLSHVHVVPLTLSYSVHFGAKDYIYSLSSYILYLFKETKEYKVTSKGELDFQCSLQEKSKVNTCEHKKTPRYRRNPISGGVLCFYFLNLFVVVN